MVEFSHMYNYLCLPFCKTHTKGNIFSNTVDKMGSKVSAQKAKTQSFAGRGVLVQSVVQSLSSYAMKTYLLPKNICKQLDTKIKNFLWVFDMDKQRNLYLKSWHSIYAPKEVGELGFRRMRHTNSTFITKLVQQPNTQPDRSWVKVRKVYMG